MRPSHRPTGGVNPELPIYPTLDRRDLDNKPTYHVTEKENTELPSSSEHQAHTSCEAEPGPTLAEMQGCLHRKKQLTPRDPTQGIHSQKEGILLLMISNRKAQSTPIITGSIVPEKNESKNDGLRSPSKFGFASGLLCKHTCP